MSARYTYPNGVLINKLGIVHQDKLEKAERALTSEAESSMPKFSLDFQGLKDIHGHLFKDVYSWAGEPRTSILSKDPTSPHFTPPSRINHHADKIFSELGKKDNLRNLSQKEFAVEAAHIFGEINQLHPFREGNGRTQRIFIEEVARQAGHQINFNEVTKERMIQASIEYSQGSPKKMLEIFNEATDKEKQSSLKGANDFLKEQYGIQKWNGLYIAHSHENNTYHGVFVGSSSTGFMIQLRGDDNNGLERNSIIISRPEHIQYLSNPKAKSGETITLKIPELSLNKNNKHSYQNTEKPELGKSYTGIIVSANSEQVIQKILKGKDERIITHDTKNLNLSQAESDLVGKKFQIRYNADGKGTVKERSSLEIGKQKELDKQLGKDGKGFGLDDQ